MKRAALFLFGVVVAAGIVGVAAPVASPPSVAIASGVSVSGVEVGGLTSEPARDLLREAADRPLTVVYAGRRWRVRLDQLNATASVDGAIASALLARPDERLELGVRVPQVTVRRFVARLARTLDRPARNAQLVGLVAGRPFVTADRTGIKVRRGATERAIAGALEGGSRRPVRVVAERIPAWRTRSDFGPVIVIDRGANSLRLYRGMKPWRAFRVATGSPYYPTPSGTWRIVTKQRYPWWYPPNSSWARGAKPIPPGPGNPLGTRWMGLSVGPVGIHGTPNPASIGYSASHGCIRMYVWEAEWLFERVQLGTPVIVV